MNRQFTISQSYMVYVPGSLSFIVTVAMDVEPISTTLGLSKDSITTEKVSDISTTTSSMVGTIKMADVSPALKLTVYGPGI